MLSLIGNVQISYGPVLSTVLDCITYRHCMHFAQPQLKSMLTSSSLSYFKQYFQNHTPDCITLKNNLKRWSSHHGTLGSLLHACPVANLVSLVAVLHRSADDVIDLQLALHAALQVMQRLGLAADACCHEAFVLLATLLQLAQLIHRDGSIRVLQGGGHNTTQHTW
jgi:hypothetical protein